MKIRNLDVLIVRLLPFVLYIITGIIVLLECFGIEMDLHHLHGNSAFYALSLFFISLSNKHYHCQWNRAMYLFLIAIPLLNYLDVKFNFIKDEETYILSIVALFTITAFATAYLAIRHFNQATKLRQK